MTTRTNVLRGLPGVLGTALIATVAAAQSPANDARWEPWLGCWQPVAQENAPFQRAARVCVTQLGGAAVEIATVADGRVVARDTIDASGARRAIGAGGCTGWQRADWSPDARRVYLHSEISCGSSLKRTSSGVLAMSDRGEWLDVQGANANGNSTVREVRYDVAGTWTSDLPVEFVDMVRTRELTPYAMVARQLAGSPIRTKDVVEAVKQVDSDVVQAWLIERGQELDLDARGLLALANAGVPGDVTDVLIGLAFPERFTLRRAAPTPVGEGPRSSVAPRYAYSECESAFDPMWYSMYGFDACAARFGNYAFGYRSPYGYGNYGYGYGYGYDVPFYGSIGPVSVGPRKPEPPHGVAVNGKGYTRPTSRAGAQTDVADQGSSRVGRNPSSGSGGGSSSSGGKSSGGSSSGGSSSGSSSGSGSSGSGRTAQARPPDPPKPVKPPPAP
jgi:hypothetical protein